MRTNFINKAFLLTAALFSSAFASDALTDITIKKNHYSNTATFIDGITEDNTSCGKIDGISQYAIVSEKVFQIKDICNDNYVIALSTDQDNTKFKMIKAKIVESSSDCNDAQIILNKETYDKISTNDKKADIVWAIVNSKGEFKLKVNYDGIKAMNDFIGIPPNVIEKMFEETAKDMVAKKIDAQGYPWDVVSSISETKSTSSSSKSYYSVAAVAAAAAGFICFAGYKAKSKRVEAVENNSIAIPELPPLDATINTVTDHPEGLPRVDIYNPPLEFYHFPMNTSYDIVDVRPDLYD